jgi:hypothetical protein
MAVGMAVDVARPTREHTYSFYVGAPGGVRVCGLSRWRSATMARRLPAMQTFSLRPWPTAALLVAAATATHAAEIATPHTLTVYSGRISSEATWQDVLLEPYSDNYTDSYLLAASYTRAIRERFEGALRLEYEVNVAYNFGEQDHWELNVAPLTLRWQRFPWSNLLRTTVAFGLGFSYAFDTPEVEYRLENDTQQFLLFWQLELTAGPREGPWSAVVRLHHRSPGWGVMGVADGGMNAPSIGFRYAF